MNLMDEIQSRVKLFADTEVYSGLTAVVHHIEIAQKHLISTSQKEPHLATDVIYRTNQAFEGSLKEAYRLLRSEAPEKKRPYDIERYFEKNGILKDRVLRQFTTYRQDWRNRSTHDYKLFFSEQEALLAVVSVSAFLIILLDQMIEALSYINFRESISKRRTELLEAIDKKYSSLTFYDQCVEIVRMFGDELTLRSSYSSLDNDYYQEYEFLGQLSAFTSVVDPQIEISTENTFTYDQTEIRADLVFQRSDETVILEFKLPTYDPEKYVKLGLEQLKYYSKSEIFSGGILFLPAKTKEVETKVRRIDQFSFPITVIMTPIFKGLM